MAENSSSLPGSPMGASEKGASPSPSAAPTASPGQSKKKSEPVFENKDSLREIIETVVFVVVLVLLLKSFVAEAFVIPTGSMAETLYGYQKLVTCPKCRYNFPVNCSGEVDPQQGQERAPVVGAICPNCRYNIDFDRDFEAANRPAWNTGDRVLVGKYLYDLQALGLDHPNRLDVVVFKFPDGPQRDHVPMNYIKRLVGLPGETIAIYYGKLYTRSDLTYDDSHVPSEELWTKQHMHCDEAASLFREDEAMDPRDRKFHILRKPPAQILSERRIVYDNDFQSLDLVGKVKPRWQSDDAAGSWTSGSPGEPKEFDHLAPATQDSPSWLRYHHLIPSSDRTTAHEQLVTDFMGYNTWRPQSGFGRGHEPPAENWVGDLQLECKVNVLKPVGSFMMELSKGADRFRAKWDLASGVCTLTRITDRKETELASKSTSMRAFGEYKLRFANVDERLAVWVDSGMPFGDGVGYDAPRRRGPTTNDLQPASIGCQSASVRVSGLKLWRDTYYTDAARNGMPDAGVIVDLWNPERWGPLQELQPRTFYVQPGHYLCMGDNSPESWDGRSWGLVPKRLLLGRALLIYYPFGSRWGRIQ